MKKILLILLVMMMLTGCCLSHEWTDATCTAPKTCTKCGETEGETLEHTWSEATCTAPKTCTVCSGTEGDALGHDFTYWYLPTTILNPTEMYRFCRVCDELEKAPIDYETMTTEFFVGVWQGYAMMSEDYGSEFLSLEKLGIEAKCIFLEDGTYMQVTTDIDGSTYCTYGNWESRTDSTFAEKNIWATGVDGNNSVFFSAENYLKPSANTNNFMASLLLVDDISFHVIYSRVGTPTSADIEEIHENMLQVADIVGTWYREYEYNGKWMESTFIVNEDGTYINEHFTDGQPSTSTGIIEIFGNEYRFIEEGSSGYMALILKNNTLSNKYDTEFVYERK